MSRPRTVAEVLGEHVTLEVEGDDRMYLNVYQPRLQTERGVAAFFRCHRGETFASSALMDPMSKSFIAAVDRFVLREQIPLITFAKGQRKDDVAKEHHAQFHGTEGIVFVGRAQYKTPVFRTEKWRNPDTGQTYPWIVRSTAMVNYFYFYGLDADFGPFKRYEFRNSSDLAASPFRGPEAEKGQVGPRKALGVPLGPETTGLRVDATVRLQPIPTGVYHLLDPQTDPLLIVTVKNESHGPGRPGDPTPGGRLWTWLAPSKRGGR
jgi:hypothetical protein